MSPVLPRPAALTARAVAVLATAALAVGLLPGAAGAETVGVSRCDREVDGALETGLMTVDASGNQIFRPVGEDGLTQSIVLDPFRAFEWVAGLGQFPVGTTFANYQGYFCGELIEAAADLSEEVDGEESEAEEPDSDGTGDADTSGADPEDGDDSGQNRNQNQNAERERNSDG